MSKIKELTHSIAYDENKNVYFVKPENLKQLVELSSENKLFDTFGHKLKFRKEGSNGKRAHFYLFESKSKDFYRAHNIIIPESFEHYKAKDVFREYIEKNNYLVETEKYFKDINRYSDVYFRYKGQDFVIEIQNSNYSHSEYSQRTKDYKSINVNILWIALIDNFNQLNKFWNLFTLNGDYLIYFEKKSISINNLVKVTNFNSKTVFLDKEFTFEEFIQFLYDKNYNCLNLSEDNLKGLKKELSELKSRIFELKKDENLIKNGINAQNDYINKKRTQLESEIKSKKSELVSLKLDIENHEKITENIKNEIWKKESEKMNELFYFDLKYKGLNSENDRFKAEIEMKNKYLRGELEKVNLKLKKYLDKELFEIMEKIKLREKEYSNIISKYEVLLEKLKNNNYSEELFKYYSEDFFWRIIKYEEKISKADFENKIKKLIFETIGSLENKGVIETDSNYIKKT